jgi:transposase
MRQNQLTRARRRPIDIGKNSFHIVGQNQRGAIVLRQKWSRGQVEARLANLQPCRIGMETCIGAHHLSRTLKGLIEINSGARQSSKVPFC